MNPIYFSSGDAPFFYNEQLKNISWLPRIWDASRNLGENFLPRLWLDYPFRLFIKVLSELGLSWSEIEKVVWAFVAIIGFYSLHHLGRKFFGRLPAFIGSFIYLANTYALLLFGGGQLGVALAYAFAPLVLARFMGSIERKPLRLAESLQNGLFLSVMVIFDLRLAYLMLGAIALYAVLTLSNRKMSVKHLISLFVVPACITVCVHAFWIIPMVMASGGTKAFTQDFVSVGMLRFLSVADFSHTLSLLHPNWPENLFGRVYFLQPEFLIIPLLAFASLLFLRKTPEPKKQRIVFFGVLALIGSFLAKGSNDPFGGIYEWCFTHIPGFVMFRDPTKFYLFVAIGYSILIPFTLERIVGLIKEKTNRTIPLGMYHGALVIFIIFWGFTVRPLFLGQLSGNFRPKEIHEDFYTLKDILLKDQHPSRTLWLPRPEKFAYSSDIHPVLSGDTLFKNSSISGLKAIVGESQFTSAIYSAGVKYVIIPMDTERRIFLSDYAFDSRLREQLIMAVTNSGLVRDRSFDDLAVFINPNFNFRAERPDIVMRQEYWSRIGLMVSVLSLIISGFVIVSFHKRFT